MRVMRMKKQYNKPQLRYEDFRLMDAIAANCLIPAQHGNKYECAWWNEDFYANIYATGIVQACELDVIGEVDQDLVFPS